MGRVLIVDDEPAMRRVLRLVLAEDGHEITEADGLGEARRALAKSQFDLILTDQRMTSGDGMAVLAAGRETDPSLPVVFLTAYATVDLAVDAMRAGAFDFISKPFEPQTVLAVVRRALERTELVRTNERLKGAIRRQSGNDDCIGQSPVMTAVNAQIARVAATSATVLVSGETGVGKELAARAIHRLGARADEPFVAVNCAAFAETLLESELFGHERGAFTDAKQARAGLFETADRGTLFLDEAGEMSLGMQAKLLRVLAENSIYRLGSTRPRAVNVRIIVATHRDLKQRVTDGLFRDDLYYRLAVVPIVIPPLRQRSEDIPLLADRFLTEVAQELKAPRKTISSDGLQRLMGYSFPGNIRELRNIIERACILSSLPVLCAEDFPDLGAESPDRRLTGRADARVAADDLRRAWLDALPDRVELRAVVEGVEHDLLARSLEQAEGRQAEAARALGISRSDMSYKLRKYALHVT